MSGLTTRQKLRDIIRLEVDRIHSLATRQIPLSKVDIIELTTLIRSADEFEDEEEEHGEDDETTEALLELAESGQK